MKLHGFVISLFISTAAMSQWQVEDVAIKTAQVKGLSTVNTSDLEFSPAFYFDEIAYVQPPKSGKKDRAIGVAYFELNVLSGDPFANINAANEHIGPMALDEMNNILYFTQSKKKQRSRKRPVNQIIEASFINDAWVAQDVLPFCKKGISYQHPTLSSDGTSMIFSSDANTSGAFDLYMSKKIDSTWTEPTLLSAAINTQANEAFPFLYQDSILFYASNKPTGLGGYDIYVSIYRDGAWQASINLGNPVNTPADDFGFILDDSAELAYLSSNRSGGKGEDDIYTVEFDSPIVTFDSPIVIADTERELIEMEVEVREVESDLPLSDVLISVIPFADLDVRSTDVSTEDDTYLLSILPKKNDNVVKVMTDAAGQSIVTLASDTDYFITIQKEGYDPYTVSVSGKDRPSELSVAISRKVVVELDAPDPVDAPSDTKLKEPIVESNEPVLPPIEDREILVFDQVYYEFNSSELRQGSTAQLDKLVEYMLRYPDMRVELTAHTDSRGYRSHNQKLSQRRAEAAKAYLIARGIAANRITALGKGEDQIRNHCTNGVFCTEKEHEYNRRTEVRVIYD